MTVYFGIPRYKLLNYSANYSTDDVKMLRQIVYQSSNQFIVEKL